MRVINTALQQALQILAARPRLSLGTFPTPLQRIEAPGGVVWIKDDSACSPVYGGNKVRKLEFLLAHLAAKGMRRVTVWGDVESHTVAAVARLASAAGFEVDAVVFPSRNAAADAHEVINALQAARATVHRTRNMLSAWARSRWLSRGGRSALLPLGVSMPQADIGYVPAVIELSEQLTGGAAESIDRIYVPLGSGGTVAGLLVGLAVTGLSMRIVAVRTVDRVVTPSNAVRWKVRQIVRELQLPDALIETSLGQLHRIEDGYLGRGYRDITPAAQKAVVTAAALGVHFEPVFTGKTFACLLDDLQREPAVRCLFWNTHDPRHDMSCDAPSTRQA